MIFCITDGCNSMAAGSSDMCWMCHSRSKPKSEHKQTRIRVPEGITHIINASNGKVTHVKNELTGNFEKVDQE